MIAFRERAGGIPATSSLRCKVTPSFMRLIITRTVAKETYSNIILQQVYWAVSQPSPFDTKKSSMEDNREGLVCERLIGVL